MKLYSWIHFVPSEVDRGDKPWQNQTHCCVVLKTNKEFMERFGYGRTHFKSYVHVKTIGEARNPGEQLALDNPGVVYGQDIWHHTPGEKVYIVIPS